MDILWRAFPLRPSIPPEGVLMAQVARDRGFEVESMENRFKAIAAESGLAFNGNPRIYNTRKAHELSIWATENGKGHAFHNAVFIANYVDGKDISSVSVLADTARSVGLSEGAAAEVLAKGTYSRQVDLYWDLCRELSIMAAPTLVMNEARLVGAQPYEKMVAFVTQNGAKPL